MTNNKRNTSKITIWQTYFLIFSILILFSPTSAFSAGGTFYLKTKSASKFVGCNRLRLNGDYFNCSKDGAIFRYQADMVEKVEYKKITVYPYDRTIKLSNKDLRRPDCDYIKKHISGPLLLEPSKELFVFIGTMYEYGICTKRDIDKAFHYYQKGGDLGKNAFYALEEELKKQNATHAKAEINPNVIASLQADSDRKRMQKAKDDAFCQSDCMMKQDSDQTENKYRFSKKCHADCMENLGH